MEGLLWLFFFDTILFDNIFRAEIMSLFTLVGSGEILVL
jgi:hypothetical protein